MNMNRYTIKIITVIRLYSLNLSKYILKTIIDINKVKTISFSKTENNRTRMN